MHNYDLQIEQEFEMYTQHHEKAQNKKYYIVGTAYYY